MSDMKHTPGPWLYDGDAFVYSLNSHDYNRIYFQIQGGHDDDQKRITQEELEASAMLAAAAPDMLAALELSLAVLEQLDGVRHLTNQEFPALDATRAAIAKAKGEA